MIRAQRLQSPADPLMPVEIKLYADATSATPTDTIYAMNTPVALDATSVGEVYWLPSLGGSTGTLRPFLVRWEPDANGKLVKYETRLFDGCYDLSNLDLSDLTRIGGVTYVTANRLEQCSWKGAFFSEDVITAVIAVDL